MAANESLSFSAQGQGIFVAPVEVWRWECKHGGSARAALAQQN